MSTQSFTLWLFWIKRDLCMCDLLFSFQWSDESAQEDSIRYGCVWWCVWWCICDVWCVMCVCVCGSSRESGVCMTSVWRIVAAAGECSALFLLPSAAACTHTIQHRMKKRRSHPRIVYFFVAGVSDTSYTSSAVTRANYNIDHRVVRERERERENGYE